MLFFFFFAYKKIFFVIIFLAKIFANAQVKILQLLMLKRIS